MGSIRSCFILPQTKPINRFAVHLATATFTFLLLIISLLTYSSHYSDSFIAFPKLIYTISIHFTKLILIHSFIPSVHIKITISQFN